jgi:hypothetical protein
MRTRICLVVLQLVCVVGLVQLPTARWGSSTSCASFAAQRGGVHRVQTLPARALRFAHPTSERSQVVRMQELPFWENVGRFARFFITASTGLVVGLLSPFRAFLRTPTLTAIGASLLIGFLVFLTFTLQAMNGSSSPYQPPPAIQKFEAPDPKKDPTMQRMLNDIYGP